MSTDRGDEAGQGPAAASAGGPGFRLMLLSGVALAIGALIAIAARGFAITDQLIGYALAGLLLLAPFPMLAGDLVDVVLVLAVRRRWLAADAYRRAAAWAVPGAVLVVGMAIYPIVLAIGGADLLGVFVIVGAFVLFGVFPVGAWLLGKARRRRSGA